MTLEEGPSRGRFWLPLLGAILFAIAHTQAPLYFSNQNQYFVHGAAMAGVGELRSDWLANTLDPTPLFSKVIAFVLGNGVPWVVYIIHALLMATYFLALLAIARKIIPNGPSADFHLFLVGCGLIVIHAGIIRHASVELFGIDYPWYLQSGVAGQYVLGPGLQPSAFGVLLVVSVAAFAHGRLVLAVLALAAACWMHATYLLPGALLTAGYLAQLARQRRWKAAGAVAVGTLLAVLPVVVYSIRTFPPSTPEMFAEAQRLLAHARIPHHTLVRRWLDPVAETQMGLIAVGLFLLRRTAIFLPLLVATALAAVFSFVQVATESDSLALLFPWRLSVVLMPIATSAVVATLTRLSPAVRALAWVGGALAIFAGAGGVWIQVEGKAYYSDDRELAALEFIREHRKPGQVYLIPVRVPAVGAGPRGSVSLSFTPPPRPKDKHHIAVDLQRFRLYAGTPIYVDFKSIPYQDAEVLEWWRRLQNVQRWFAEKAWDTDAGRAEMRNEGITHVLLPAEGAPVSPREVYRDDVYRILSAED